MLAFVVRFKTYHKTFLKTSYATYGKCITTVHAVFCYNGSQKYELLAIICKFCYVFSIFQSLITI